MCVLIVCVPCVCLCVCVCARAHVGNLRVAHHPGEKTEARELRLRYQQIHDTTNRFREEKERLRSQLLEREGWKQYTGAVLCGAAQLLFCRA